MRLRRAKQVRNLLRGSHRLEPVGSPEDERAVAAAPRSGPAAAHESGPAADPGSDRSTDQDTYDCLVIGAGQAGLSASYHLIRRELTHLVLDANRLPGGAWQHRWKTLTMHDVHGVSALPGMEAPDGADEERASGVVPAYFAAYEKSHSLPVRRPVKVRQVRSDGSLLRVETNAGTFTSRTLINATGTWSQPFIPFYQGADTFTGHQLHTVDYEGPEVFAGSRVIVVGGGASAVQILGELAGTAETVWVTRTPPVWREGPFGEAEGRAAVALVDERVRAGFRPQSVVSVTGLMLRPQEQRASELGAYERLPMFSRIEAGGARWKDGHFETADVIIWATGFRPAIGHLAALHLRDDNGGIRVLETVVELDPRIHLVGYGPSASTIGANRAGQTAARQVDRYLSEHP